MEWLAIMRRYDTPGDEIVLYALSRMAHVHSIVYSKTATWCTVAVSQPILPSDLHKACSVKLMFLGKHGFGELVQKPSYSMPVYQPDIHMENRCTAVDTMRKLTHHQEVPPPPQGNGISTSTVHQTTNILPENQMDVVLGSVTIPDQGGTRWIKPKMWMYKNQNN